MRQSSGKTEFVAPLIMRAPTASLSVEVPQRLEFKAFISCGWSCITVERSRRMASPST